METYPKHILVVQQPAGCMQCGRYHPHEHSVTVQSIEQSEDNGWKLRGTGRVSTHCPMCGAMFDAVRSEIPIECQSYPCPKCGGSQDLDYKVQKIDAQGNEFSFQAEICCRKCQRKKTFVQTLKELFKLKKLEIKLTGISIER